MYGNQQCPPFPGHDSFRASPSAPSLYSLRGMEQPVPSFKSFVRSVAPPPLPTQHLLPPVSTRSRSSSVYSQYNPESPSASGPPSSGPFYLQPTTYSHSESRLPVNRPRQVLQVTRAESTDSSPLLPDLCVALESSRKTETPTLLQPRTYTPVPSSPSSGAKKSPSSGSSSERPRFSGPSPPPSINIPHTVAYYEMTVDAVKASYPIPKASPTLDNAMSTGLYQRHRVGMSNAPHVQGRSRDKAMAALGLDGGTLQKGAQHQNPIPKVQAASASRSRSFAKPLTPPPPPPLPPPGTYRDSRLLSLVLDSYTQGSEDYGKPEAQLFSEDYHALLSGQKMADAGRSSRESAASDTRPAPLPLFWKNHDKNESMGSKHPIGSSINFSRILQIPSSLRRSSKSSIHGPVYPTPPRRVKSPPSTNPSSHVFGQRRTQSMDDENPTSFQRSAEEHNSTEVSSTSNGDAGFRFSPTKDRAQDSSVSPLKPQRLINSSRTLLSLRPSRSLVPSGSNTADAMISSQSGIPGDTFDYNRPIPRPSTLQDQDHRIKAAIEKVKEEIAAGVEGAVEMLKPIWEKKELPAEKVDPFGIERTRPKQLERETDEDRARRGSGGGQRSGRRRSEEARGGGERGRSRRPNLRGAVGGMSAGSSVHRSKSEKRREELKKRIKLVGEVNPYTVGMPDH